MPQSQSSAVETAGLLTTAVQGTAAAPAESLGIDLPRWPLFVGFGLYPLSWLLGLGPLIWPILSVPMVVLLAINYRAVRLPRSFLAYTVFLVWTLLCASEIDSSLRYVGFAFRLVLDVAGAVIFLYVYNASRRRMSIRWISLVVTSFWLFVVFGGLLGILFPRGGFGTPLEHLLPASVAQNDLVRSVVHPTFSQIGNNFDGRAAVLRPSAPFTYTNRWGFTYSLCIPFVISAVLTMRKSLGQALLLGIIPLSLLVAFETLDRGMFVALAIALVYVGIRFAFRGEARPLAAVVGIGLTLALLTVATGLITHLNSRLQTSASNAGRLDIYSQAFQGAQQSPIFGQGAPRPPPVANSVSIGTQGQVWMIMFSYGFVGLGLFLYWLWGLMWRTRSAPDQPTLWLHTVVVMAAVEVFVYSMQMTELMVVMVAGAIVQRELSMARARGPKPRVPSALPPRDIGAAHGPQTARVQG